MTRCGIIVGVRAEYIVALCAFLGTSACAGGGPSADDFAKEACAKHSVGTAGDTTVIRDLAAYDQQRGDVEAGAALAAKAASADRKWDALSTAYSGELDVYDAGRQAFIDVTTVYPAAPDPTSGSVADLFADAGNTAKFNQAHQTLEGLALRARDFEATARAECRKALA